MTNKRGVKMAKKPKVLQTTITSYTFEYGGSPGIRVVLKHNSLLNPLPMHEDRNWTKTYNELLALGWRVINKQETEE
jgi:hypothetical protein